MRAFQRLLVRAIALVAVVSFQVAGAQAQLVDTPQNLLKAWTEAYASRSSDAIGRVYAKEAHMWGLNSKELAVGIDSIKKHYARIWDNVAERSVTISKSQVLTRRRVTIVSGTMEIKSKSKDGVARSTPARFTMSIIRESRRQWVILSHHMSPLAN